MKQHEAWEITSYVVLWDGPAAGRVEELPITAMTVLVTAPDGLAARYSAAGVVDERIRMFVFDPA